MIRNFAFVVAGIILLGTNAVAQNGVRFSDSKPGMRDERLERQAVFAASRHARDYHWHEKYTRAVILSPEWEAIRGRNGSITGRRIHVLVYCKMDNGDCGIGDFTFKQNLVTEGVEQWFSDKLQYESNGDVYLAACE